MAGIEDNFARRKLGNRGIVQETTQLEEHFQGLPVRRGSEGQESRQESGYSLSMSKITTKLSIVHCALILTAYPLNKQVVAIFGNLLICSFSRKQ